MNGKPLLVLLLAAGAARADDAQKAKPVVPAAGAPEAQAQSDKDAKELSGMSVLGNQEAPKALVIVPWKSSEIGDSLGISTMLDDSRQPIDRDVFMRELGYYEIRSEKTTAAGEKGQAAQPATAAHRRKS
jgi:hypothetical protein